MSSQQTPQAPRFPIEAGDCPTLAVPPETQEPVDTEQSVGRQCHVVLCHAMPCRAVPCHAKSNNAMRCHAGPCRATGLTRLSPHRQLRRCPGSHCLTLPNVPIDVFIAMGGSNRPRTN
ncbi:protein FAM229A [Pluvialis apricaria]